MVMNPLLPLYFAESLVESIKFGDTPQVSAAAGGGVQPRLEGVDGNGWTNEASPKAQHVGVIMFAGEMRRRNVVHERRAYARNFVRGHGDSYARATNHYPEVGVARGDTLADRGAKVGVVHRILGVRGAQINNDVAPIAESSRKRCFQVEAGVI
jgi:hypothetical protein